MVSHIDRYIVHEKDIIEKRVNDRYFKYNAHQLKLDKAFLSRAQENQKKMIISALNLADEKKME